MKNAPYEQKAIDYLNEAQDVSLPYITWINLATAGVYALLDIANAIRAHR